MQVRLHLQRCTMQSTTSDKLCSSDLEPFPLRQVLATLLLVVCNAQNIRLVLRLFPWNVGSVPPTVRVREERVLDHRIHIPLPLNLCFFCWFDGRLALPPQCCDGVNDQVGLALYFVLVMLPS